MPDYSHILYFSFTHVLAAVAFVCALLLWSQRKHGERSRSFLAITWAFIAVLYLLLSIMLYGDREPYMGIMPVIPLVMGFYSVIIMLVYPVEVVSPLWLNFKRFAWLFSPVLLATVLVIYMRLGGFEFRIIDTFDEFGEFFYEPNVWIRVLISVAIFVYAAILIFYIPRNRIRSNATLAWMLAYTIGTLGICIFYFGRVLWGTYPFGVIHTVYLIVFIMVTTYQEMFVRLFVVRTAPTAEMMSVKVFKVGSDSAILDRLEAYMKSEEPWRDPNLSRDMVAEAIKSNRTTISRLVSRSGCDNFYDYIARYRIDEFCRVVRDAEVLNIQETFFNVGFRSKTAAFAQFKQLMGTTPGEWIKKVKRDRH